MENLIEELANVFKSRSADVVVVYGKPRVGKTSLVLESLRRANVDFTYYACTEEPLEFFLDKIAVRQGLTIEAGSVRDALLKLCSRGRVLVLDGFNFLVKVSPSILGVVQDIVGQGDCIVVLISSNIPMMEEYSEQLERSGLRVYSLRVEPLKYRDLGQIINSMDWVKTAYIYSVVDGIVEYAKLFTSDSFWDNVKKLFLSKNSLLYREVPLMIKSLELKDYSIVNAILSVLAGRVLGVHELQKTTGLEKSRLNKYLAILREHDLVDYIGAIPSKGRVKPKHRLFYIKDLILNFYYKYIFPHISDIELGLRDELLKSIVEDYDNYMSYVMYRIALQLVEDHVRIRGYTLEDLGVYILDDRYIVVGFTNNKIHFYYPLWGHVTRKLVEKEVSVIEENIAETSWARGREYEIIVLVGSYRGDKIIGSNAYILTLEDYGNMQVA